MIIVEEGTFNRVKEFLFTKGVSKSQIKIPRVVTTNKRILDVVEDNKLHY